MAKPPRSMALNPARAPDSLPMGVRAPARMTEPGMDVTSDGPCQPDGRAAGWWAGVAHSTGRSGSSAEADRVRRSAWEAAATGG